MSLVKKLLGEADGAHSTMTVGELINELNQFPPETPVYYAYDSGDHWRTVIAGDIKEASLRSVKHSDYHEKMTVQNDGEGESDDDRVVNPDQVVVISHTSHR